MVFIDKSGSFQYIYFLFVLPIWMILTNTQSRDTSLQQFMNRWYDGPLVDI